MPEFATQMLNWELMETPQKGRMWYLMAFSLITDLIWIIYWGVVWNSYPNSESGTCIWTLVISVIEFIVKTGTVGILFLTEPECKAAVTNLVGNLQWIYQGPKAYMAL